VKFHPQISMLDNVLRKLKFTLSNQTLSNIYLTFIKPTLEYACEVWDGCFEREVAKLETVQFESARIVLANIRICLRGMGWV
jgi:hypothetical protein